MQIISPSEARKLGLKKYFTGKPCKNGHVCERVLPYNRCIECSREVSLRSYKKHSNKHLKTKKEYYKKNKDKISEYQKRRKVENPEYNIEYQKKYRSVNGEALLEDKKHYYQKNKKQIQNRIRKYNIKNPTRNKISNLIKRTESNWKGGRKKAESILGYTYLELKSHIESQFEDGMSWERRSEFHIDHIKPIKAFLDEGVTDPKIINALSNLQPLWAKDNLSKGAKWEE